MFRNVQMGEPDTLTTIKLLDPHRYDALDEQNLKDSTILVQSQTTMDALKRGIAVQDMSTYNEMLKAVGNQLSDDDKNVLLQYLVANNKAYEGQAVAIVNRVNNNAILNSQNTMTPSQTAHDIAPPSDSVPAVVAIKAAVMPAQSMVSQSSISSASDTNVPSVSPAQVTSAAAVVDSQAQTKNLLLLAVGAFVLFKLIKRRS